MSLLNTIPGYRINGVPEPLPSREPGHPERLVRHTAEATAAGLQGDPLHQVRHAGSDRFPGVPRRTFPDCKIIFSRRNVPDVAKSSWWANSGQIDDSLKKIRALLEFLGEDLDELAVRDILTVRHGPPTLYAQSPG
jgi:hypothetical protein